MTKTYLPLCALVAALFFGLSALAQHEGSHSAHDAHNQPDKEEKFNPTDVILHHVSDAHDWHLLDYKDEHGLSHPVSIPLPIILFTDGNLDIFMSSAFEHGHSKATKGNRTYVLDQGHISETSGLAVIDVSITKNVAAMLISALLLILVFNSVARSYKGGLAPSGLGSFLEPMILFVKDDIALPNIGKEKHERYLPYLLTTFFFIWFNNMLGLLPGSANVTGNIAVTLVLSTITLLVTNMSANKHYWKHIFLPPVPLALYPIMVPIEIVGVLTKPFALMVRLFANITAGHIIILSLVSLIFVFKSLAIAPVAVGFVLFMYLLELLVAILQAYIFTLLTALFIGTAVAGHTEH